MTDQVAVAIKQGKTIQEIIEDEKLRYLFDQHRRAYRELANVVAKENRRKQLLNEYEHTEWKPWQQGILDMIDEKADDRTIHWIYDEQGNIGKTYLKGYLQAQGKAFCPSVTKHSRNHRRGYDYEPIVIFDVPRSKQTHMQDIYHEMVQFKDGIIENKCFLSPHVIVFANFCPRKYFKNGIEIISLDRWSIIKINEECEEIDGFKRKLEEQREEQEQVRKMPRIVEINAQSSEKNSDDEQPTKKRRTYII